MYKGQLVNLRFPTTSDIEFFARFQNQEYIINTYRFDTPGFIYKETLLKNFKEKCENDRPTNDFRLTIETKDGKVIGEIGLEWIFWKNSSSYMYQYIGELDYLEGGYKEEAIKLFLEAIFDEMNIRKLKIFTIANDQNSLTALKNNNFKIEVIHKEDVLQHGKYIDVYEMAAFRD